MKITQLYLTSNTTKTTPVVRGRYQNMCYYLTMFITDTVKRLRLDGGDFNRVVFEEGFERDFVIEGNSALCISIPARFTGFDGLDSSDAAHKYFLQQYLSGLGKLDEHFAFSTVATVRQALPDVFAAGLFYEKQLDSSKTFQAIERCHFDRYELVLRNKATGAEQIVYTCAPDPFVVAFDVNRVLLSEGTFEVRNKLREQTLCLSIGGM